jgi:protocatechuate 3,4-dioxygenase beta subunit
VDLDGFQESWFGANTSTRPHGTLKLAPGDNRYGITFRLRPLGSIAGVVFDPDGDPLPNVSIDLLKAAWERLKPAYRNEMWANTDDRGRYRFHDVVPGQYLLMATQQNAPALLIQPEIAPGQTAPQQLYGVQFYPDASRLSAAAPVQLADGKELEGMDFHLAPRAVARLRGKIVLPGDLSANQTVQVQVHVYTQDLWTPASSRPAASPRSNPITRLRFPA